MGRNFIISLFLYQILGIWLPGFAVISTLKIRNLSVIEKLALSFGVGYCFNILMYFLFVPFSIGDYMIFGFLAIDVIAVFVLIRNRQMFLKDESKPEDIKNLLICCGFIFVITAYLFLAFAACNRIPGEISGNTFYQDLLHWIGNSTALVKGYPPVDFRTLAPDYHYHYFSSVQIAAVSIVTKIPVAEISFYYSYLQSAILLVLSAYCCLRKVLKNNRYVLVAMLILLFTAGFEKYTNLTFIHHIYLAPFGFDIGLSFALLVFYCVCRQLDELKINFSYLFLSLVFIMACAGTKGPIAVTLLAGSGLICFYWIMMRRFVIGVSYGVGLALCFGFVYYFFLSGASEIYQTVGKTTDIIASVASFGGIYDNLISFNMPVFLAKSVMFVVIPFLSHPWIFGIFAFAFVYRIFRIKSIKVADFACLIIVFTGIFLTMNFRYIGLSQMYFLLSTYPFALIFGIRGIGDFYRGVIAGKSRSFKTGFKIAGYFLAGVIVVCGNYFVWEYGFQNNSVVFFKKGISNVTRLDLVELEKDANYVSAGQYLAYKWIRDNTDPDAIFLCDAALRCKALPYSPGAFTERYIYFDKDERLAKKCMENDRSALSALKGKGVRYIIQTKSISPVFELPHEDGSLVFENAEVKVWGLVQEPGWFSNQVKNGKEK
ncbi:MAG: hypothetical protein ACYCYI_07455 [Saccharofermentanales bacterium]